MSNRFNSDRGAGFRGNTYSDSSASSSDRGGNGAEQDSNTMSSAIPGNPHSSHGFRRALERTQAKGNRLKDQMPDKSDTGGPGYRKPNYFAQGGRRHGLHISSGAPHTAGATQEGSDAGGE